MSIMDASRREDDEHIAEPVRAVGRSSGHSTTMMMISSSSWPPKRTGQNAPGLPVRERAGHRASKQVCVPLIMQPT